LELRLMINRNTLLVAIGATMLLAACSKPAATTSTTAQAEDVAAMAAQKAELANREAEVAAREAALAAADAAAAKQAAADQAAKDLMAQQAAAKAAAPAPKPVVRQAAKTSVAPKVTKPAEPAKSMPVVAPAPVARVVTVPAGTQLSMALSTELSSKTAKVGDTVRARLTSDVMIDGRVAIAAGTTVAGQVTDVVSGSAKVGGIPTLGMRFDRLELPGGKDVPISGEITQKGKSDRTRDTVKILGGAAAGAVLGHQVESNNKGKIIGGLLGGAVGAVAAQKTGTEVQLPADTAMSISLAAPLEVTLR
jgi:Glycine zipper 2TM domain